MAKPKRSTEKERFNLELTPKQKQDLKEIQDVTGTASQSEAIRNAINLYKFLLDPNVKVVRTSDPIPSNQTEIVFPGVVVKNELQNGTPVATIG